MDFQGRPMLERYEQILFFGAEELERRWSVARQVVREQGQDLLLVLEGSYEGYNHWFLGNREFEAIIVPAQGPVVAVLGSSVNREETYCKDRPVDWDRYLDRKPVLPIHPQVRYVRDFDPRDFGVKSHGDAPLKIACIHPEVMRQSWYEAIENVYGAFALRDIGLELDAVRVVKGEEEQFLISQVNAMNEKLMSAARQVIRPGRSVKEITDEVQYMAMQLGSGGHFVHVFCPFCGPQDEPSAGNEMGRAPFPGSVLHQGDRIFLLIETNGPGGHYSALGRFFVLGKASEELKRYWEMAVKAQKNAARMLRPGVTVREISDANKKYIEQCGFVTNDQNYLHSLGFQYGEQPYLNAPSEHTPLRAGMHYIAHPVIIRSYPGTDATDGLFVLDTYYVTPEGGVRSNTFPQEIIELPYGQEV